MDISNKVIGISGIGLMGGSLAAAIKKYLPDATVIGYDSNQSMAEAALSKLLIDDIKPTFDNLVNSADIIFLAAPASSIIKQIKELHSYTKNLIISDLCSVKRPVMKAAKTLSGNMVFVGGHPMAGSQKTGNQYADPEIFRGAPYVLCPAETGATPVTLINLIKEIGAHPIILSPEEHDKAVSQISHLPQILAVALLNELHQNNDEESAAYRLAAGGFKDITRIGESAFSVWKDILEKNKDNLIIDIGRLIVRLQNYKDVLQKGNLDVIGKEFGNAGDVRKKLR